MADTPDFQLGFAAGFKLGSDAKDYKKQIEEFRTAEAASIEARKRTSEMLDRTHEKFTQLGIEQNKHAGQVAAWNAVRDMERQKLDDDAEALVALRQNLERREGMLPHREAAVMSRENTVAEREAAIAKREAEADAMKRKYEVLIEKIDAARAAA